MKATFKRLEASCKIVLAVIFILLYFIARSYPSESRQFPQLIAAFTLVILVISLIRDFTGKSGVSTGAAETSDAGFQTSEQGKEPKEKKRRLYITWIMILVSTALGFWGGFLITTFLLFMGFALFLGEKKHLLRNSLSAIAVTALIYFVFEWIMRVPLLGN